MEKRKDTLYIVFIAALILLVVMAAMFLNNAQRLRHAGMFRVGRPHIPATVATSTEITMIKPWMTFEYLSLLFNVPPNYLKTSLNIASPQYPRISIEETAEEKGIQENLFLESVKQSISAYGSGH